MPVLFALPFYDELASGLPTAGAGDVVGALHLSATAYAIAVFAIPTAIALVVEAPLFAFADARPHLRPRLIALGVLGMATGILVESFARDTWLLAVGVTLYGPCCGLAVNLGEGILVDADAAHVERTMSRLAVLSNFGDALAPLVILAGAFHGAAVGVAAALFAAAAPMYLAARAKVAAAARATHDHDDDDDEDAPPEPTRVALRAALGNRRLLAFMFAATMCTLLDETLTAFAGLFLHERFGAGVATAGLVASCVGAALGVLALEKVRRSPLTVLVASSLACLAAFGAFLASTAAILSVALAFFVGVFAAPLYPYTKAQAYRCLPGRSGVVNAVFQLFGVIDVFAPVALALVADRYGVRAALACLALEPVIVGALAAWSLARRGARQGDVATAAATSSSDAIGDDSADAGDARRR